MFTCYSSKIVYSFFFNFKLARKTLLYLTFILYVKLYSGLAQSGAWLCCDEFNRIDIEVLSVIAQQLLTIRNAKMQHLSRLALYSPSQYSITDID